MCPTRSHSPLLAFFFEKTVIPMAIPLEGCSNWSRRTSVSQGLRAGGIGDTYTIEFGGFIRFWIELVDRDGATVLMIFGRRVDELEAEALRVGHGREGADVRRTGGMAGGKREAGGRFSTGDRKKNYERGALNGNRLKFETHLRLFSLATVGMMHDAMRWSPSELRAGPGRDGSHHCNPSRPAQLAEADVQAKPS